MVENVAKQRNLNLITCRLWVKATGDEDLIHLPIEKLHELKYICGSHFVPEFFNTKGNRLLKTAVPTVKLTRPPLSDDTLNEFPLHVKSFYEMRKKDSGVIMSNVDRRNKIPAAPSFATSGNLLSNVAPPTELPNFITTVPTSAAPAPKKPEVVPQAVPVSSPVPVTQANQDVETKPTLQQSPESPEKFSPAIPLSKGEPTLPIRSPEDSLTTLSPESLPESISEIDQLGDVMPGSGILTWMKGAVSSGGILQRVAEKAKSSVDSMITTLDPQMKEYLRSGGDLCIVVASDKEVKVSPVREAFQTVFGKATVIGHAAQSDVTAAQPVGYAAAYAAAKQRIAYVRSEHNELTNNVPIVAIEGFIQETVPDRWYEMSLLVLTQPSLGIELQLQSQATPVPGAAVAAARAAGAEPAPTGYCLTIGSIMATNLQVPHTQWHEATTGVSRREILLFAARSLAGSYKKLLAVAAET
ncbi:protein PRRC1-like isoform X2 [Vanessa atalanta]|uniref:protein PRRC1-like isoform X2 n=1 Tax=Vanessa atalanta TaxID=42275 RepID=UPI001FCCC1BC|nr:protein PRRC1-like isoform X2 [Vanessa atalanta]